jgi:hypothetical protein
MPRADRCPERPATAIGTSVAPRTRSAAIITERRSQRSADEPAVEAEDKGGHAVGETHGDYAERTAGLQRDPHQRDVVERVAELAGRDREEGSRKSCRRSTRSAGVRGTSGASGLSSGSAVTRSAIASNPSRHPELDSLQ